MLECIKKFNDFRDGAKDGGWAWVVCLVSSLMMFLVNGFSLTIGLLYTYLLEEFGETRAKTGNCNFHYINFDSNASFVCPCLN